MEFLVTRDHWYSWNYRILCGNKLVASVRTKWSHKTATVDYNGTEYQFSNRYRGPVLFENGSILIFSVKKFWFKPDIFELSGETYLLQQYGFRGAMNIIRQDRKIGFLCQTQGFFKTRCVSEIPNEIPELAAVFLICIVITMTGLTT